MIRLIRCRGFVTVGFVIWDEEIVCAKIPKTAVEIEILDHGGHFELSQLSFSPCAGVSFISVKFLNSNTG